MNLTKCFCVLFLILSLSCFAADAPKISYRILEKDTKSPKISAELSLEGFPKNAKVEVTVENLEKTAHPVEGLLTLNDQKQLMKQGVPFVLTFDSVGLGEPFFVKIKTEDGRYTASTKIVPSPNIISDSKGHSLSIEVASGDGKLFSYHLVGYKPYEKLQVVSKSDDKKVKLDVQTTKKGTLDSTIAPIIDGKKTGKTSLEVNGDDSSLKLNYIWGLPALQPLP